MPKSQSYQWPEEAPVHVSRRPPNPGGAVVQDWKAYGYGGFEKSGPGIHCKAPATKRRYAPGRKPGSIAPLSPAARSTIRLQSPAN